MTATAVQTRIYAACLAAYNNGKLHGTWIELDEETTLESLQAEISLMLAASPEPGAEEWDALVHPGQKLKPGARVVFEGIHTLHGEILERRFFGRRLVRLWTEDGSIVDEALLTNSPLSFNQDRRALLSMPSSFASSWTRALPGTVLLLGGLARVSPWPSLLLHGGAHRC